MEHTSLLPCPTRVPIFHSLSDQEINKITNMVQHITFKKGELLLEEGERTDNLFIIHSGKVKLTKWSLHGKEQILHFLTKGDFFGENNLFHKNAVSNLNAYAIEETKICLLTKADFDSILEENQNISFKLLKTLTQRLSHTEDLAQLLSTKDPEVRIAHMLLEFCEKFGSEKEDGILIQLPLTREEISSYVGLTRETLSRKLSKFVDSGWLTLIGNKQILIKDRKKLQHITEGI